MFFGIVHASSVFSDLISPQLFDFKFIKTDNIPDNTVPYKTEKRQFHCSIPPNPDSITALTPREDIDYSQYLQLPKCLYLNSGWWTYSYCENEVKQLHLENNVETDGYTLGRSTDKYELQERNGQYVIVKNFSKGTLCDVSQKPREVRIEYSCFLHNEKLKLTNCHEVSTCLYKATVHVPELCNIEGFQKKTNTNDITCYYLSDKPKASLPEKSTIEQDDQSEDEGEMETNENIAKDGQIDLGKLTNIVSKLMDQADIQMVMLDDKNIDFETTISNLLKQQKEKEAKNKKKTKKEDVKEEL